MKTDEFDIYWKQYISIEKELNDILKYVTLSEENYHTFSDRFVKILLEIGSEIDITCKEYCKEIDNTFSGSNIDQYRECIMKKVTSFTNQKTIELSTEIILIPWENWNLKKSPYWWNAYNKVKHERTQKVTINNESKLAYKFANLENVLNALAGYYQILIYLYYELAEKEKKNVKTPLPGSRHFNLKDDLGDKVTFYYNTAKYIDDNLCLVEEVNDKIFY